MPISLPDNEGIQDMLWYQAKQNASGAWKGEVIEAVVAFLTAFCSTSWTDQEKENAANVVSQQFSQMVRNGNFAKNEDGRYLCIKSPISQLALPFDFTAPAERIETVVQRIVRDTKTVAMLKALYEYSCSLCSVRLKVSEDEFICEVHHLRPLGTPHDGPDTPDNMMVLCLNHHALFERGVAQWAESGVITVGDDSYTPAFRHHLARAHIQYYRQFIQKP